MDVRKAQEASEQGKHDDCMCNPVALSEMSVF